MDSSSDAAGSSYSRSSVSCPVPASPTLGQSLAAVSIVALQLLLFSFVRFFIRTHTFENHARFPLDAAWKNDAECTPAITCLALWEQRAVAATSFSLVIWLSFGDRLISSCGVSAPTTISLILDFAARWIAVPALFGVIITLICLPPESLTTGGGHKPRVRWSHSTQCEVGSSPIATQLPRYESLLPEVYAERRLVVVSVAHTLVPGVLDRWVLAERQLSAVGGEFHPLLWVNDRADADAKQMAACLRSTFRGTSAVPRVVDESLIRRTYPGFIGSDVGTFRVASKRWAWAFMHVPLLVWHRLSNPGGEWAAKAVPSHVFFIEPDVAWLGSLPDILMRVVVDTARDAAERGSPADATLTPEARNDADGDEDEEAGSSFDFLSTGCIWNTVCTNFQRPGKCDWRTPGYIAEDKISACRLQVARFSSRLLERLADDTMKGRMAFCEMVPPSVCLEAPWCRAHELSSRFFDAGFANWTAVRRHDWSVHVAAYVGAKHSAERKHLSRFFHSLKWLR